MEKFEVSTKEEFNLAELNCSNIEILKIIPVEPNHRHLLFPISVKQNFLNGISKSFTIVPITYYSNFSSEIATDLNIDIVIRDCKYTTMILYDPQKSAKEIKLTIHYNKLIYAIDELIIYIVKQMDGINYSLTPNSFLHIKQKFPNANPVKNFFASFDVKDSFENLYGSIEKYVIPALTDLDETSIKKIGKIIYMDPRTNTIINEK